MTFKFGGRQKVENALGNATSHFEFAIRRFRAALELADEELAITPTQFQEQRMQGFLAAIAWVSATPLLDTHGDVRQELVAQLEHELNAFCDEDLTERVR